MKIPRLYRWVYRDSGTGRFVDKDYADRNPTTTEKQRVWFWQRDNA
jgi:hypothetical protein